MAMNGTRKGRRMESTEKNQPVAEYRIGAVKGVVWKNDTRNGIMFSTTLVRIYKDQEDEWKETHSLGRDDLLVAAKVLDQVHSFIVEEERRMRDDG